MDRNFKVHMKADFIEITLNYVQVALDSSHMGLFFGTCV